MDCLESRQRTPEGTLSSLPGFSPAENHQNKNKKTPLLLVANMEMRQIQLQGNGRRKNVPGRYGSRGEKVERQSRGGENTLRRLLLPALIDLPCFIVFNLPSPPPPRSHFPQKTFYSTLNQPWCYAVASFIHRISIFPCSQGGPHKSVWQAGKRSYRHHRVPCQELRSKGTRGPHSNQNYSPPENRALFFLLHPLSPTVSAVITIDLC